MTKKYDFGTSLNQKILEGVNVLADNVASTLGPKGRNVILQEKGKRPIITKDGVTVAQFVTLQDPMHKAGRFTNKQCSWGWHHYCNSARPCHTQPGAGLFNLWG